MKPAKRTKRDFTKPRCINCGICCMNKRFPVAELKQSLQEIIKQWVSPLIVEETYYVCDVCVGLAAAGVESAMDGVAVPRELGHKAVCLSCGRSVVDRQRVRSERARRDPTCYQLLLDWAGPLFQNSPMEWACWACWHRAQRQKCNAERRHTAAHDDTTTIPEMNTSETSGAVSETTPSQTACSSSEAASSTIPTTNMLRLATYKRARLTPRRCIFKACPDGRPLFSVPLRIRQKVLREHDLYIPNSARICNKHIAQHNISLLSARIVDTFSGDHIEDMIFLMKNIRPIDFGNVEGMDPYLRETWLGVTWDEFKEVLDSIPELTARLGDAQIALAMYFMKKHAREGDEVIASLFQVPRPAMVAKVQVVEECLARRDTLAAAIIDNNKSSVPTEN